MEPQTVTVPPPRPVPPEMPPQAPSPLVDHASTPIAYEPRPTDRKVAISAQLDARERAVAAREKALDEVTDQNSSKITQASIDQQVVGEYALCAFNAFKDQPNIDPTTERALRCTTIAILVLRNGFVVVGESVVASPENYDAGVGRKSAVEDAKRQLWQLENYSLKTRMSGLLVAPDYELRRQVYRDAVARNEATSSTSAFAPRAVPLAGSSPTSPPQKML